MLSRRDTFTWMDAGHRPHRLASVLRWGVLDRLTGARRVSPPGPGAPRIEPDLERLRDPSRVPRLTWLGHASFLGSLAGTSFLIDPVFAQRLGPLYRRHVPPALRPTELPRIDALLVTHSHYDHLDALAARHLPRTTPVFVPLGLGRWFERRGFDQVTELSWWETASAGSLEITLTPARHWSKRGLCDTNRALWGGFVLSGGNWSLYHAGDTAYVSEVFRQIGERWRLTAALLPIGAYRPAWFMEVNHMNPEQAGRAFVELGARHLIPMHWGTFQLTDEPLREPPERLTAWWRRQLPPGGELHLLKVGETITLDRDADLAPEKHGSER